MQLAPIRNSGYIALRSVETTTAGLASSSNLKFLLAFDWKRTQVPLLLL